MNSRAVEDTEDMKMVRLLIRQEIRELFEKQEHFQEAYEKRLESLDKRMDRFESMLQAALNAPQPGGRRPSVRLKDGLTDEDIKLGNQYLTELHHPRGKRQAKVMVVSEEKMANGQRGYVCIRLTGSERTLHRKLRARPASELYKIPAGWEPEALSTDDDTAEDEA